MSGTDYADIANMSFDDIPEPKVLPDGVWILQGRNATYLKAKEEDQNDRVLFFYAVVGPTDSVSDEDLDEAGIDGEYDLALNQIVKTFWIDGPRAWKQVKAHMSMAGVEPKGNILEVLKEFA